MGDAFHGRVARALDGPLVVLFEQNRAFQTGDGCLVGVDAKDFGPTLDLTVEALQRVLEVELDPMLGGEALVG